MTEERTIPNTQSILLYMHCSLCISERSGPPDIEVGWTKIGFQVWCRRHQANIMHIDFEGRRLPANMARHAITEAA